MSRYGVPFSKGPVVELKPHPDSCGLADVRGVASAADVPLAIDLFSGAGGFSYGLTLAGFKVVLAIDIEADAARTHRAHFPGASICADLSDHKTIDAICNAVAGLDIDLVAGGPPCQPYSQAAFSKVRDLETKTGRPADPRRQLWSSYLAVVDRVRPRAVLVENVPDMAFGRDGIVLRRLVEELETLGYSVHTKVLASDAFGVPQHRQRLFTAGFRGDVEFQWPSYAPHERSVIRDVISDLPPVVGGDKVERRPYAPVDFPQCHYFRGGVSDDDHEYVYDHHARAVRQDDLDAFELMDSTTKYSDLPQHLKRYRDDIFEDKYKRLGWTEVSRTITAHMSRDGYWYIHPEQHRTLTIREAARLQTFPDNFRFCGFPRSAYRQIGEAVPPRLARAVGEAVATALRTSEHERLPSTGEISSALSRWLAAQPAENMKFPWLRVSDPWTKLLGHLMFQKAPAVKIARLFRAMSERWPTAATMACDEDAGAYLRSIGMARSLPVLGNVARLMATHTNVSAAQLAKSGFRGSAADVAAAVIGAESRRPVTAALARIAKRFWDTQVTEADGRGSIEMVLGRLVGIDDNGSAYCGAMEIAARYCGPKTPQCGFCPLASICLTGRAVAAAEFGLFDPRNDR